jgi:altronate dehydratase
MELVWEAEQRGARDALALASAALRAGLAVELREVAAAAHEADNMAVAACELPAGARVRLAGGREARLAHAVLEGHRFASRPVAAGERLLSWGRPFGVALRALRAGEGVFNAKVLAALAERSALLPGAFRLPSGPNFEDFCEPFGEEELRQAAVGQGHAAACGTRSSSARFAGLRRRGGRGVGTRNCVIVLATSNQSSALARAAADELRARLGGALAARRLDSVVHVTHTESGTGNNAALFRRTLAGWVVHPNVACAVVVSRAGDAFGSAQLREELHAEPGLRRRLRATPHCFFEEARDGEGGGAAAVADAAAACIARALHDDNCVRTAQPVAALTVALQCGGSDAFSGLTANPLIGEVSRLLVLAGGCALLAETDELIGAESYVLERVRSLSVARRFLAMEKHITELLNWHGVSAEGNPSGGNLFRGIYNIALKSLGAATKKPPGLQLDGVVDYSEWVGFDDGEEKKEEDDDDDDDDEQGQPHEAAQRGADLAASKIAAAELDARGGPPPSGRGYLFMHSPGNDLESIAGQVASGCNVIFFTTGNGSVTNFPFVPTIKIVTTSARFALLSNDMDFDAGRLLTEPGASMASLGAELYNDMLAVAAGRRLTVGERALHAPQVSVWRDWQQTGVASLEAFCRAAEQQALGHGRSICATARDVALAERLRAALHEDQHEQQPGVPRRAKVALVVPTSLCSSEVARAIAKEVSAAGKGRCVAVTHTEGCGSNYGHAKFEQHPEMRFPASFGEELLDRILVGHIAHPLVATGLLLEHGCEMNHNGRMAARLDAFGVPRWRERFATASVQLDGGVDRAVRKSVELLSRPTGETGASKCGPGERRLAVALLTARNSDGPLEAAVLRLVARAVLAAGGDVVAFHSYGALAEAEAEPEPAPALRFAQALPGPCDGEPKLFRMESCTEDWVERVTGLASAGVDVVVAWANARTLVGHPFVPVLHVGLGAHADVTCRACESSEDAARRVLEALGQVLLGKLSPKAACAGNVDFQIARGPIGVSV